MKIADQNNLEQWFVGCQATTWHLCMARNQNQIQLRNNNKRADGVMVTSLLSKNQPECIPCTPRQRPQACI